MSRFVCSGCGRWCDPENVERFEHVGDTVCGDCKLEPNEERIREALKEAVHAGDARRVGQLVDRLRFHCGASYETCYTLSHDLTGISPDDWEEILLEADGLEK